MIAYTMLGTNNMDRALAFYDALLGEVGGQRAVEVPGVVLYAGSEGTPLFCVAEPWNKEEATVGNGSMIGLAAESAEAVDKLYERAIELGATDDGPPGPRQRGELSFYAGYFRDPDGNKLSFFHM
jgi:catechol 2,3-dioxygenase-like lactoylglutathione lyase family enzyme